MIEAEPLGELLLRLGVDCEGIDLATITPQTEERIRDLVRLQARELVRRERKREAEAEQMRFAKWCGDNSHSIGETLDRLAHHGFRNYKTLRFYVKRFFAVFYRRLPRTATASSRVNE